MSETKKKVKEVNACCYAFNVGKCVFFVFCFVYFVWSAYEISTIKSELKDLSKILASISTIGKDVVKSDFSGPVLSLSRTVRVSEELKQIRYKRSNGPQKKKRKQKGKRRRRRCKCPRGRTGPPGPPGEKGDIGPPGAACAFKAAHFVTNPPTIKECIAAKNGIFCPGNKTFWSENKDVPIPYFQEADWMKNRTNNSILQLGSGKGDSIEVLQSGVYLIYAQVEKHTTKSYEYFGIFVSDSSGTNEKRVFHCADSIDSYTHSSISDFFNAKEKTCNMVGMHHLEKGDILRIKVITSNTAVTISHDKTFFGAVLLS